MAEIVEATKGKIRDKPINGKLKRVLLNAAEATAVDVVVVISGGQAPKGSGGKRIGSTRHDNGNAADLQLVKSGRTLSFGRNKDRQAVAAFVTAAAANGATGIGAGKGYMGTRTLHIGFGSKAVWGKGGKAVNAPGWLTKAVNKGWNSPAQADDDNLADFEVFARNGLHLRQGPKRTFPSSKVLPFGSFVHVMEQTNPNWWLVDLEGDGRADGYVHKSFLRPA